MSNTSSLRNNGRRMLRPPALAHRFPVMAHCEHRNANEPTLMHGLAFCHLRSLPSPSHENLRGNSRHASAIGLNKVVQPPERKTMMKASLTQDCAAMATWKCCFQALMKHRFQPLTRSSISLCCRTSTLSLFTRPVSKSAKNGHRSWFEIRCTPFGESVRPTTHAKRGCSIITMHFCKLATASSHVWADKNTPRLSSPG